MLENVFRITQLLDVKAEVELYLTSRLHCCVNLFISVSSFQLKGKLLGVKPRRCHFPASLRWLDMASCMLSLEYSAGKETSGCL